MKAIISLLITCCAVLAQGQDIPGCTDPLAPNFNPNANIDDGSCCFENIITIQSNNAGLIVLLSDADDSVISQNFENNSAVCIPDGCYQMILGSDNLPAEITLQFGGQVLNFSIPANQTVVENITIGNSIEGCTDSAACNYQPEATCDDNSCFYNCVGCTDPLALNYNADAEEDNGTCCYDPEYFFTFTSTSPVSMAIGFTQGIITDYLISNQTNGFCAPGTCFRIIITNTNDEPITFTLFDSDGIEKGTIIVGANSFDEINFSTLGETGCTDPGACNYNPDALCLGNETCDYNCYGCTDPDASNYNPLATIDDGSCCGNGAVVGCMDPLACNFNSIATCSDLSFCVYNCYGCTDPNASNYNPDATIDDNSCCLATYTITSEYPISWNVNSSYMMTPIQGGSTLEGTLTYCLDEGCYNLFIFSEALESNEVTISDEEDNVVLTLLIESGQYEFLSISFSETIGCTDENACNFNPTATCDDSNLCDYSCLGCTDPLASNYSANATVDNGSCCYSELYTFEMIGEGSFYLEDPADNSTLAAGQHSAPATFCYDQQCLSVTLASNGNGTIGYNIYDPQGNLFGTYSESNTTIYQGYVGSVAPIVGCTNSSACNYNPDANCNNELTCDFSCLGCTDPNAPNYNPDATIDDGSCCIDNWYTLTFDQPTYWSAYNGLTNEGGAGSYPLQSGFCLSSTCFTLNAWSPLASQVEFYVYNPQGELIYAGQTLPFGSVEVPVSFSAIEIAGCTDPEACNYNPDATCDAGNCTSDCFGCIDPEALNFDPNALEEDNSCIYSIIPPVYEITGDDESLDNFYFVDIEFTSLGNGAPYIISNDVNLEVLYMDENGVVTGGPYPCDQVITFNFHSISTGLTIYNQFELIPACYPFSTEEIKTEQTFGMYPNPSNGLITISGIENTTYQAQILDMTGRVVLQQQINGQTAGVQLNIEALAKGYYTLQLSNESSVMSRGIVKE